IRFEENEFTWAPIQEVGALFVGIFLTMVPALQVLRAAAPNLPLNAITLFVFSGALSSVLDNAPTYVTFFEMATQLPGEPRVADVPAALLISGLVGAVLCGAMFSISNGPTCMVKYVAVDAGVRTASCLGSVRSAFVYLAPVLLAMVRLFIADPWWAQTAGALTVALLLVRLLQH